MSVFVKIDKGRYVDSLETLYASSVLVEQNGIVSGFVGMATNAFKEDTAAAGLVSPEMDAADQAAFDAAAAAVIASFEVEASAQAEESFVSTKAAVQKHPEINLCSVSVPGEYAYAEVKKALNAGLHCVVFSNNVPLDQEREMKLLAREKGLLGISGVSNDLRYVIEAADAGNARAKLAVDVFVTGIVHYIGSFFMDLEGLTDLVFTAGIGEHSDRVRAMVCEKLGAIGVKLDEEANKKNASIISAPLPPSPSG